MYAIYTTSFTVRGTFSNSILVTKKNIILFVSPLNFYTINTGSRGVLSEWINKNVWPLWNALILAVKKLISESVYIRPSNRRCFETYWSLNIATAVFRSTREVQRNVFGKRSFPSERGKENGKGRNFYHVTQVAQLIVNRSSTERSTLIRLSILTNDWMQENHTTSNKTTWLVCCRISWRNSRTRRHLRWLIMVSIIFQHS